MSANLKFYVKSETLATMAEICKKNEFKGIELIAFISDESNKFGQNVTVSVSQTKEEREAKLPPFYVGNGAVFQIKGSVCLAKKAETAKTEGQPTFSGVKSKNS